MKKQKTPDKNICEANITSYMSSLKIVKADKNNDEPWRCHNKVRNGEKYCYIHRKKFTPDKNIHGQEQSVIFASRTKHPDALTPVSVVERGNSKGIFSVTDLEQEIIIKVKKHHRNSGFESVCDDCITETISLTSQRLRAEVENAINYSLDNEPLLSVERKILEKLKKRLGI